MFFLPCHFVAIILYYYYYYLFCWNFYSIFFFILSVFLTAVRTLHVTRSSEYSYYIFAVMPLVEFQFCVFMFYFILFVGIIGVSFYLQYFFYWARGVTFNILPSLDGISVLCGVSLLFYGFWNYNIMLWANYLYSLFTRLLRIIVTYISMIFSSYFTIIHFFLLYD